MKLLNKIDERRTPHGLEITILRHIPRAFALGTAALFVVAMSTRIFPPSGTAQEVAKKTMSIDILSIAFALTFWTGLFTVAVGCIVVYIMKGPAYVADAYPVSHASRPTTDDQPGR